MSHTAAPQATAPQRQAPLASSAPDSRHPMRWLLAALALLLALLAFFVLDRYRQAQADAAATTRNLVQLIESHLSSDFARVDGILGYIASGFSEDDLHPALPDAAQVVRQQRLAALQASFAMIGGLSVFDAQGALLYASDPSLKGISIADRPHFQRLRDDPLAQLVFSEAQVARTTGRWSIVMVRPLHDRQGSFLGTVNAVIALEQIGKLFGTVDVAANGGILLRNSETFKLIQRMPRLNENDFNQPLPKDNATRQHIEAGERAGTLSFTASTDSVERLASFKRMDAYPFYVQVALANSDYLADWYQEAAAVASLAVLLLLGCALTIRRWQKSAAVIAAASHQLAYRQALFAGLFEQSGFLAGILDASGHLLEVNQTALATIGLRHDQVVGQVFADTPWWQRAEDRAALQATLQAAAQGKAGSFEAVHRSVSGTDMTVLFHAAPVLVGEDRYIAVTGIDISVRKAAEQELAQQRLRLSNILWGTGVGTWEWHVQSGETRFNARWAELLGYTLEELAPLSIATWLKYAHPDDLVASEAALKKHFAGELDHYQCETRMRHKLGHWIWVLDRGKLVSRSPDGQPEWMAGTHWDITERKLAECALQQQTEALARSNAELEQFAYIASHDLRQPLRMVNSYLQLIERALAGQLNDDTREMMHFATDGAKRMDQMLMSLLEYSRVGRKGEPLALLASREPVEEALHFLAPAIQEAQATVRLAGDWPQLLASRDEFTRLWQNLIGNAVKYRALDRAPEIDITVTPDAEGAGWRFCVADNGIGIDPAQFGRLFKVFQRLHTRDQYQGSGIGLAVARKIVQRHGGRIWVESAGPGQGCRFCFDLPARQPDTPVLP